MLSEQLKLPAPDIRVQVHWLSESVGKARGLTLRSFRLKRRCFPCFKWKIGTVLSGRHRKNMEKTMEIGKKQTSFYMLDAQFRSRAASW